MNRGARPTGRTAAFCAAILLLSASTPASAGKVVEDPVESLTWLAGLWNEQWASDIHNMDSIELRFVSGHLRVFVHHDDGHKPWTVWGERYRDGTLTFEKRGGDSDWAFTFKARIVSPTEMELTVYRHHDSEVFQGRLYR